MQEVTSLLQQTRYLPTLQLFDAIWSVFFSKLHREGHTRVLRYLQADVCQSVPLGNLSKAFRIAQSAWGRTNIWFAGHWNGVLGTKPGSAGGTQSLEAFHGDWEQLLRAGTRPNIGHVLSPMQELFTDRWTDYFQWGRPRDISLWPKVSSSMLLHGQSFHRLGRRPARGYWSEKDRPNCAVVQMTDSSRAHTTCHVMHACDPA